VKRESDDETFLAGISTGYFATPFRTPRKAKM